MEIRDVDEERYTTSAKQDVIESLRNKLMVRIITLYCKPLRHALHLKETLYELCQNGVFEATKFS